MDPNISYAAFHRLMCTHNMYIYNYVLLYVMYICIYIYTMFHLSTWRFVHHTLAIRFRAMNQLQDCHPDTTALARGDEGCLGLKVRHWVPTGYPQNGDLRQLREIWGIWWWTMMNLTSGLWKEHAIVGQIHSSSERFWKYPAADRDKGAWTRNSPKCLIS